MYVSKHVSVAAYAARVEFGPNGALRTWQEYAVALGVPIGSLTLLNMFGSEVGFPFLLPIMILTVLGVFGARWVAPKLSTARYLYRGRAITAPVRTDNPDLIAAAIGTVIEFDVDPEGAAKLIAELDVAWRLAAASTAHEKGPILAALRQTAESFPTTDDGVRQVRQELAAVRRSLGLLQAAQRQLDAATSTADLADPPEPPASIGLLRAAAQSLEEEAELVSEVAQEQGRREASG